MSINKGEVSLPDEVEYVPAVQIEQAEESTAPVRKRIK